MDKSNIGGEKKNKRPRIGTTPSQTQENNTAERPRFERVAYERRDNDAENGERRPYQQRPYRQNYHQQRPYGGYQHRSYSYYDSEARAENTDSLSAENTPSDFQQHRSSGYRQHGQNNYRQYNQGGYHQQGQNNYRQQGESGYNRQSGYRQQGQGSYRSYNQSNYRQQDENGYNRQGGYRQQGESGYRQQGQNGYRQQDQGSNPRQNNFRGQRGFFPGAGKSFVARPKRIQYEQAIPDPNEQIRLNKFMSNAGICSRREADEFIQQGLVKVNGIVVTELGTKISHSDVVEYDEKVLALESKCYVLLNKPKDCVTTSDDPQGRTTVMDLVKGCCNERIYPVGRLDRNTTGVLLLTNDGDLASKLTHPKFVKKKIYHVWCDKDIAEEDMQRIADGIELEDGPIHADAISYATETDRNQAGIEIHSGRNRIVRRIFESLGYHVTKLDRVYFAGLTKKNLPRGRWRYLTQEEVNHLKMGAFE